MRCQLDMPLGDGGAWHLRDRGAVQQMADRDQDCLCSRAQEDGVSRAEPYIAMWQTIGDRAGFQTLGFQMPCHAGR
jgi:hypothetical protein